MTAPAAIRLEFASGRAGSGEPEEINEVLHRIGFGAWPMEVNGAPPAVGQLLAQPTLTVEEGQEVQRQFLLPRERLLEIITAAGRTPQVPGGGDLGPFDATNDLAYPQLYVVEEGVDYTRFDTFHVNTNPGGPGIDEVMQLLVGGGFRLLQHLPGEGEFTVTFDGGADGTGWTITYDGGRPHIGSLTRARPGTKLLVQAIGPPRFQVTYVDGDSGA